MDARVSIQKVFELDEFFKFFDWFKKFFNKRAGEEESSLSSSWFKLDEFRKENRSFLIRINVDPAGAMKDIQAWGELLEILGFKEDSEERVLLAVERVCANCGARNRAQAKVCSVCGTSAFMK